MQNKIKIPFFSFFIIFLILTTFTGQAESQPKNNSSTMIFQRVAEPRENAFTLLIPKGWQIEGGILRINPLTQGGAAQSIAAKIDFAVKKDRQGSVMIRWLPDMLYFDARMSPAGQMGLFPPGSNYNGLFFCSPILKQVAYRLLSSIASPN
jgi:hypothetical protein